MRSIRAKFLVLVGAFAILLSGFALWSAWLSIRKHAEELTASQADLALEFDLAIRRHVGRVHAVAVAEAERQLVGMAVAIALFVGLVLLVFRLVVGNRLAAITAHFQQAAAQDEEAPIAPIPVKGNDEISVLASSFNAMAARLQSLHASLEDRVRRRTAELEAEIAERKQTERELREHTRALELANRELEDYSQAARAATRAKSEFLANMSHEIRTPITAVLGYTDLLIDQNLGEQASEHLKIVRRNGKHLLALLNDILDLSKIESGRLTLELAGCSLAAMLREVQAMMQARAEAKGLRLACELEGPIPESIHTDPTRLRQILFNLVGNAVKFTDRGGVRVVASAIQEGTPQVQIDVIDTGIGMTSGQVARLFRSFSQADASTTRQFGGTGLGLAISKRLAQALGGDVALVDSRPGAGSRFRVTIPLGLPAEVEVSQPPSPAASEPEKPLPTAPASPAGPSGRVLLAEDSPDNQRLLALFLKKAGLEVAAVDNGRLAVEAALAALEQGDPFGVILMDIQMPIMDGCEATRALRDKGYTLPIIALTAHAMAEDRQKCLAAGCDDYLAKPVDRETLLLLVARHARVEQPAPP